MVIQAVNNLSRDLPKEYMPYHQTDREVIPLIDVGKEYAVYGVLFEDGVTVFLSSLGRNFLYKVAPTMFKVVDNSVPDDWVFNQTEEGYGLAFSEWFEDSFYWNLSERHPEEIQTLERYTSKYSTD